ncbi:MAG: insulinase family protein [Planctomycetes bacterium]|nr:insulinase family protein [Planctomycetota bacterium]MCB9918143.1 insulinase family protein [Planctomycetota bacterium]
MSLCTAQEPLVLDSGVEILFEPVPGADDVGLFCFVKCGYTEDPPGRVGLAHFVEHLVTCADTDERKGWDAMRWTRERKVANAMTRPRYTVYFSIGERSQISSDARRFADVLRGKLEITQDLVDRERARLVVEIANMTEIRPGAALQWRARAMALAGTPESVVGIGLRQDIATLDTAMLRRAVTRTHRPDKTLLVVVGNVDPKRDLAFWTDVFGKIEAPAVPEPIPAREASVLREAITPHPRAGAPFGVVAFRAPEFTDSDFAAFGLGALWLGQRASYSLKPRGRELEAGLWPALYAILDEPRVAYFGRRGNNGERDVDGVRHDLRSFLETSRAAAQERVIAGALPILVRQVEQLLMPGVDLESIEEGPEARAKVAQLRIAATPNGLYRTGLSRGTSLVLGFRTDLMDRFRKTTAADVARVVRERFAFELGSFAAALPASAAPPADVEGQAGPPGGADTKK